MRPKRQGCTCESCRECCTREPGWFVPDEVSYAAAFMNLTEQDFVAYYCQEHFEDGVYAISPATKPRSAECIFLNAEHLCDIHPVKPYECRKVYGCEGESRHRRMREIIKRMWR